MSTSKKRFVSGFLWNLGEKLLIQVLTFIVGLVLARKLGPDAYGLVATVSIIISFLTVATNLNTGSYLNRKKEVDSLDMNTAFYFNLFVSVIVYLVLFFAAPFLASFYEKPELTSLLRVMGISVLVSSLMAVKLIVIVRNYEYKKLFFASSIGTVCAGVTGIVLAFNGFGAWALVAQHCLDCVVDTIILWIVVKWLPRFEFSFKRLLEMAKYGFPLWVFGFADLLSSRLQQLIIGKKYTSADLAYFNRGESFPSIIESNAVSSLNDVLLRKVSEEQDDLYLVRNILSKISTICLYISFPTMFGLAAVATTTITLFLGEQWLPCVAFMQIFCVAFAVKPIEVTSDISLKAIGKTKQFLAFGLLKKSLFIVAVILTIPFGVEAMAIGFACASIAASLVSIVVNKLFFKYGFLNQLKAFVLPLLISVLMWAFVDKIGYFFESLPLVIILILQVFFGTLFYISSLLIFDSKTVFYTKTTIKSFFRNKRKEE